MNTDNLILRETDNLPLINKEDTLLSSEIDGNFINIYNDFLDLSIANDSTLIYDIEKSYSIGEYTTYDGRMWLSIEVSTGSTPSTDSLDWVDVFPTILAHEKNKDTILDEGGVNETTVAEIRAFIDAGLTSTTNLILTTKTATSFKIESSTGADVTIPQANKAEAGLLNATDKVKLSNLSGINSGDQTLVSLNAEDVDNKAIDFTTINDTLYPTTQAVDTYITATVPDLVETFIDGAVELNTNKAITFAVINDTLYPTVKAVDDQLDFKVDKVVGERLITSAESTLLGSTSGTNTGDQDLSGYQTTITATTQQTFTDALTVSPAPLDTMMVQVTDPAASTVKKFSWLNFKTYLLAYFDTIFPRITVASTGSVISFNVPVVWNTPASPSASNLTDDLTNAKIGYIQKIYHNKSVEPTVPVGWVLMGTGTYTISTLNVIFAEWVSSTRVEYWITKPA